MPTQTQDQAIDDELLAGSRIESFVPRRPDELDLIRWNVIPAFQLNAQQQPNWCWISTSLDVFKYYRPDGDQTQCKLAGAVLFGDPGRCCGSSPPSGCNQPGLPSAALQFLAILASVKRVGELSYPEVQVEVNARRPLVLGYTEPGQSVGHAVIILGYGDEDGTGYVLVGDPARGFGQAKFSDVIFTYSKAFSEVSFTRG